MKKTILARNGGSMGSRWWEDLNCPDPARRIFPAMKAGEKCASMVWTQLFAALWVCLAGVLSAGAQEFFTISSQDRISGTAVGAHQLYNGTTPANGTTTAVPPAYRKVRVTEGSSITIRITLNSPQDRNADGALDNYTANITLATGPATSGAANSSFIGNFSVKSGSEIATAADASLSTTTLAFAPGAYSVDVTLTVPADGLAEFDEDVLIFVSGLVDTSTTTPLSLPNVVAQGVVTIPYRDTPPGAIDFTYADDTVVITQPGANNTVNAVVLDAVSGKTIIGGDFTAFSATPRNRIARITTLGANDASFDPGSGANAYIASIAIYSGVPTTADFSSVVVSRPSTETASIASPAC